MIRMSSAEFDRDAGRYQDVALSEPVVVTLPVETTPTRPEPALFPSFRGERSENPEPIRVTPPEHAPSSSVFRLRRASGFRALASLAPE